MVQLEDNGYDDLKAKIVEYVDKAYPDKHFTFKVNTRRANKQYPHTSEEVNRDLGEVILDAFPETKVDVHNPDVLLNVELRAKRINVYSLVNRGCPHASYKDYKKAAGSTTQRQVKAPQRPQEPMVDVKTTSGAEPTQMDLTNNPQESKPDSAAVDAAKAAAMAFLAKKTGGAVANTVVSDSANTTTIDASETALGAGVETEQHLVVMCQLHPLMVVLRHRCQIVKFLLSL